MQVVGQQDLQKQLLHTIQEGRLSHANLFWGGPGTGKLATSLWIAQTLNCPNLTSKGACQNCQSCQKIAKLIHPDVHWILPIYKSETEKKRTSEDFTTEIREFLVAHHFYPSYAQWVERLDAYNKQMAIYIEEIRQLKQKMSCTPFEGNFKVVIIWHAEKMRTEAANAFLKLLEEPPPKTVFLLTAPTPEQVLPTIQSRCQSIFFPLLKENEIASYLINQHKVDEQTAYKAAFLAQGNLNEAIRLITQNTHVFDELAQAWLRSCYNAKLLDMQEVSDALSKLSRETQKHFVLYMLHILRNAAISHYAADELLFIPDNLKDFVVKLGKTLSQQSFEDLYHTLNQSMEYINRNINSKILYLTLSVRISQILAKNKAK
ncbi:MAG: DNA polymerase III subunit delta' [Bacteroidia bacterium]|nr:DNA polymerase III subunit delta' [Bacteroidia bacterium]MDW8302885.1 DNA polymerase III subunit delta' [Bacteroidia bacterium]